MLNNNNKTKTLYNSMSLSKNLNKYQSDNQSSLIRQGDINAFQMKKFDKQLRTILMRQEASFNYI